MSETRDKHFLVVAYPTFGHIIPLITFARKVSGYHFVTIIVSKSYLEVLEKRDLLPSTLGDRIKILPLDDGVPAEREVGLTPDVSVQRVARVVQQMGKALDITLPKLFQSLKDSEKSDEFQRIHPQPIHAVVVEQFLTGIVIAITEDYKLPCFVFCSDGRLMSMPQNMMPEKPGNAGGMQGMIANVFADMRVRNMKWMPFAKGQIYNVFREAEPEAVATHEKNPRVAGVPIFCVGPLFPAETTSFHPSAEKTLEWLGKQSEHSVIYVSFGTVVNLAPVQMQEIFEGLISTGKPFIWSLKQQDRDALSIDIRKQFDLESDSSNPAYLVVPWAPQKAVLSHRSVGVFVTHGGWNSITEGIFCGVPMVVWPMMLDQHSNGDWIMKKGLGVKIPDTQMGLEARVVTADEIKEYTGRVGGWSESNGSFREEAQKLSRLAKEAIAEGGSSQVDFEKVVNV